MQLQTGLIKGIPINTDHPRFIKNRQFSPLTLIDTKEESFMIL